MTANYKEILELVKELAYAQGLLSNDVGEDEVEVIYEALNSAHNFIIKQVDYLWNIG